MCGVFVAISKNGKTLDRDKCIKSLGHLKFRGPDSEAYDFLSDHFFIGQSILSITGEIVPGDFSHLVSENERFIMSFNGEIYNYKEISKNHLETLDLNKQGFTDSQVLVNLFQKYETQEIVELLDGMYSFCIFDRDKQELIICRDPQGEKSLFLYEDADQLLISSEINPIKSYVGQLEINKEILRDYFSTRHFLQWEDTHFHNLKILNPGVTQRFDLNTFCWKESKVQNVLNWVDENTFRENEKKSEEELLEELDQLMRISIEQMIPEGRKFSCVVSGGIDSSLIGAYLDKIWDDDLNFIAVNHEGKDQISVDLAKIQESLRHQVEVINVGVDEYAERISSCQSVLQGPLYSHSFVGQSIQCQKISKDGVKVLLGGEGADELFAGYSFYEKFSGDSESKNIHFSPYSNYKSSTDSSSKRKLKKVYEDCLSRYSFVEDEVERSILAAKLMDFQVQVANVGLRGADMMGMMSSVETRSPFIRKAIVKFALNLPLKFLLKKDDDNPLMRTKYILKKLFLEKYSKDCLLPKQGFSGFPNESQKLLGDFSSFKVFDFLNLKRELIDISDRSVAWKLINLEFFIRNQIEENEATGI